MKALITENSRISIIGSGIVGQAIGKVFAKYGFPVIFFDIDENRLRGLTRFGSTVLNLKEAILNSDISFFTLPTPTINNRFDGSIIESTFAKFIKYLVEKPSYHLLVIKSTVLPGRTEKLIRRFKKAGKKVLGKDYGICFNPEFLRSESSKEDFESGECPIIIGQSDFKAGRILEKLYRDLGKRAGKKYEILKTTPSTAEMIKYTSNCLFATKISLFNQMKAICERLGADPKTIVKFSLDKKTDMWCRHDFLKFGFQDECLPKDLSAFLTFCSSDLNIKVEILEAVKKINEKVVSKSKKPAGNSFTKKAVRKR